MKTAVYIDDGRTQVVLTPENDFEKNIVWNIERHKASIEVHRGNFYGCLGGYTRWSTEEPFVPIYDQSKQENSLFIVLDKKEPNGL